MQDNDASVKEMEGAGIAWAAHLFGTPLFALKSITDIVDGDRPPQEEFLENLQKAAIALKVSFINSYLDQKLDNKKELLRQIILTSSSLIIFPNLEYSM